MLHLLEVDQLRTDLQLDVRRTEAPSERLQCKMKKLQTRIVACCFLSRYDASMWTQLLRILASRLAGRKSHKLCPPPTQARPVRYCQTFVRDELVFCLPG